MNRADIHIGLRVRLVGSNPERIGTVIDIDYEGDPGIHWGTHHFLIGPDFWYAKYLEPVHRTDPTPIKSHVA